MDYTLLETTQLNSLQNVTSSLGVLGGGALFTLVFNILICIIIYFFFVCCCQQLPLFNAAKKRRLVEQVRQHMREQDLYRNQNMDEYEAPYPTDTAQQPSMLVRLKRFLIARIKFFPYIAATLCIPSLNRRDRVNIMKIHGRTIASYTFFQQILLWISVFIFIISTCVLIPIHVVLGDDSKALHPDEQDYRYTYPIYDTSIVRVDNNPALLAVHVVIAFIYVTIMLLFLILFFASRKINGFNALGVDEDRDYTSFFPVKHGYETNIPLDKKIQQVMPTVGVSTNGVPYLVSFYTLEVSGLPTAFTNQTAFKELIETFVTNKEDIIKACVVIDTNTRRAMQRQYDTTKRQYEHAKYLWEIVRKGDVSKKPTKSLLLKKDSNGQLKLRQKVDALQFYKEKLNSLQRDMDEWDNLYLREYTKNASADQTITVTKLKNVRFDYKESTEEEQNDRTSKFKIRSTGFGYIIFKNFEAREQFWRRFLLCSFQMRLVTSKLDTSKHTKRTNIIQTVVADAQRFIFSSRISFRKITYEPQDVNYHILGKMYQHSRFEIFLKRALVYLVMIIFYIFFTTPLALSTAVQTILSFGFVGDTVNLLLGITGPVGSFVFGYLPSLLLFLFSTLIPIFIYRLVLFSYYKTYSQVKRIVFKRMFSFYMLSIFLLPALLLTSVSGVINYFLQRETLEDAIGRIFLPGNGAYFINIILQFALLGTALTVLRLFDTFTYIVSYIINCGRFTPLEKLRLAERFDVSVETQMAQQLVMMAITLGFSIFAPLVSVVGMSYFVIKYFVDRYTLWFIYGHRTNGHYVEVLTSKNLEKHNYQYDFGASSGYKRDYLADVKLNFLFAKAFLINIIIFAVFMVAFFAFRIATDVRFAAHTAVMAALLVSVVLIYFCVRFLGLIVKRYQISITKSSLDKEVKSKEDLQKIVEFAYQQPQPYIRALHLQAQEMKNPYSSV